MIYKTIQTFLSKITTDTKYFQNSYVAIQSPKSVVAIDERFKIIKELAFNDSFGNYIYFRLYTPVRFLEGVRQTSCNYTYNKVVTGKLVIVAHKGNVFGLETYFTNYIACRSWIEDEYLKSNLKSVTIQNVNINKYEVYSEEIVGDVTKLIDNLALLSYDLELILLENCRKEDCFDVNLCFC